VLKRTWWRDIGTVIAVVGLLVTLGFNTGGVWMQLAQSEQAQDDLALGLLTNLNGIAHQAERQLAGVRSSLCDGRVASTKDEAALIEAAQNYDYLAWLFNDGHIDMPSARRYWSASMITTYELVAIQDIDMAQERFGNLRRFKFATPRKEWPPVLAEDCATMTSPS
jgi:hypothetical protein